MIKSCLATLTPGKKPGTHWKVSGWACGAGLDVLEKSQICYSYRGLNPRTVHPVASNKHSSNHVSLYSASDIPINLFFYSEDRGTKLTRKDINKLSGKATSQNSPERSNVYQ
jgi:hypothetical protein